MGTLMMARAGRDAAKDAAATASTMAAITTVHESAQTPMRWCALCSRLGR